MTDRFQPDMSVHSALVEQELTDLRVLADVCASYDGFEQRVSWNALLNDSGDQAHVLAYHDGVLIGFLSLSGLGGVEAEGWGMVHPRFRRRGVFGGLLALAKAICAEQHTLALILLCDSRSESGHRFLQSIQATQLFGEHSMRLASWQPRQLADSSVDLQLAALADAEQIAAILAEDAGMTTQSFLPMIRRSIADGSRHYFVATVGTTTIGTVNIDVIDGLPYIYGFVVLPEQRGKGYGRQVLVRLLNMIADEHDGPILLEVETENLVALSLYSSLGFEITQTFEYFRVDA